MDMLDEIMGGMDNHMDAVRASNIGSLDQAYSQKKKSDKDLMMGKVPSSASKGKRAAAGDDGQSTSAQKQKAPKRFKVTAADVKMQQSMNAKELSANRGFLTKLRILSRYRSDKLLWPIIKENGDGTILKAKEDTEKGVDVKLDHIRSVLSASKVDECLMYALEYGCRGFESVTGEGAMLGMDLRGFTYDPQHGVMANKTEIELELSQLKCEYGDWYDNPNPTCCIFII